MEFYVTKQTFERYKLKIPEDMSLPMNELAKATIARESGNRLLEWGVNYIFRFGPVEDMHSKGQLSQDDMKTLNKYMNDRIATLIYLFRNEDWNRLFDFFGAITKYNPKWDRAEILIEEIDKISGRK